jgi:hypothetical protein
MLPCKLLLRLLVLGALALAGLPGRSVAQTDTLTFSSTADVYVRASAPASNYNADSKLKADADPESITYLRFVVSGVAGRTVEQARLRLEVVGKSDAGGRVHLISDDTWDESTVTYSTRPAVDGGVIDTLDAVVVGDIVEFVLDGAITADGTYNLAIDSDSTDGVSYRTSTTSGQPPELELVVAAGGPPPPPPPGLLEFSPVADVFVDEKNPSANFGSDEELRVDASKERISYLRFDVAGVSGQPIEDVRLRLQVSRASLVGGAVHVISDDTWDASTMTYGTRPALDGPALETLGPVAVGDIVEFDLTDAITADGSYNLAIDSPSSDGMAFWASEATGVQRPVLIVTTEASGVGENARPVVMISAPGDGAIFTEGDTVALAATAVDLEDGSLTASITWTSSLDGVLGSGGGLATSTLGVGTHDLTAAATDSGGRAGTSTVIIVVNEAGGIPMPIELAFEPAADAWVDAAAPGANHGDDTELRADASAERIAYLRFVVSGAGGYTVTQARLRLEVSGRSVTGGSVHAVSDDTWSESTVAYDGRPAVDGPGLETLGGVEVGDIVELDVTAVVAGNGSYSFAIDSTSSDGVRFLSRETAGGEPPLLLVSLEPDGPPPPNTPPAVTITAPGEGEMRTSVEVVSFAGSAIDSADGLLSAALVWTSDIDGQLGTGESFGAVLSAGPHRITASVADSEGLVGLATVNVSVDAVDTFEIQLTPTADAYANEDKPSTNHGSGTELWVDGDKERISYLRFNVKGIGAGQVTQAVLRMRVATTSSAASDSGGTVHVISSASWSESTLTYENRPAVNGPALATADAVVAGQVVDFDVTASMVGDGQMDFALVTPLSDAAKYLSRESASPPTLILTVDGPVQVGWRDFSFGAGVDAAGNRATDSKPESKLWFNDGFWWAVLFNPANGGGHRIHALDGAAASWLDTGVLVDARPESRHDVLWDGAQLYIMSRASTQNRLYRFSYDAGGPTYTLDAGFPVDIDGAGTEAMTIAKDSTGTLWTAYTLGDGVSSMVLLNRTLGDDTQWGTPFVVPVAQGTTVAADDIAGIIAFDGKIGVFWSDQVADRFYLAVHTDGDAVTDPAAWSQEIALEGNRMADDHMNLKATSDGRLVVAVKTSLTHSNDTLVGLLVRSAAGVWSPLHRVTVEAFRPNRPICLLDEAAGLVHVFYSRDSSGIYHKTSDLDTINFPTGIGAPFIDSPAATDLNGPTTTKQNVDASSGIVVLASSPTDQSYWHNSIDVP